MLLEKLIKILKFENPCHGNYFRQFAINSHSKVEICNFDGQFSIVLYLAFFFAMIQKCCHLIVKALIYLEIKKSYRNANIELSGTRNTIFGSTCQGIKISIIRSWVRLLFRTQDIQCEKSKSTLAPTENVDKVD